ncbi:MAG TPA: Na/Pi symporter, partial [archaeon]|nr:Na/Pi symporter [archaeon]
SFFGKPIFYFGLVFFSLNLISATVAPFKDNPEITSLISGIQFLPLLFLLGVIFSAVVHSSSVTSGIVIVLSQAGLISFYQGIPLLLGANIGTTFTALLSSYRMSLHAKRAAFAHLIFNFGGVIIILPFLNYFQSFILSIGGSEAQQIANFHLFFNLFIALIFLIFITQFKAVIEFFVKGEEEEILFQTKFLEKKLPDSIKKSFSLIEKELQYALEKSLDLFKKGMEILELKKLGEFQQISKLENLADYLNERIEKAIFELSKKEIAEEEARKLILLTRMSNEIERLSDWARSMGEITIKYVTQNPVQHKEILNEVKESFLVLEQSILLLHEEYPFISKKTIKEIREKNEELRSKINSGYKIYLGRVSNVNEIPDSAFIEILSIIESSNAKIRELRKLSENY